MRILSIFAVVATFSASEGAELRGLVGEDGKPGIPDGCKNSRRCCTLLVFITAAY